VRKETREKVLYHNRPAIAMIELIFAITVMGIVLMSAPTLVNRAVQSTNVAFQQESIAAASTQIAMIMTAAWDHNDTNGTIGEPVLRTDSGATAVPPLIPNCTTDAPAGVSSASGRYCKDLQTNSNFYWASAIQLDSGLADIDDYDNASATLSIYNSENYDVAKGDYIDQNITMISRVYYGDDVPRRSNGNAHPNGYARNTTFANPFRTISANSTNIKLIQVTLTSNNIAEELSDKQISLSAFMCNIGAPRELISNKGDL